MNTNRPHLLVVDDNEMNLDLLTRRLRRQEFEVVTAENGRVALEKLNETCFDLILLDIMMPEMNGYEVLTRLKAHPQWQYIPVIVISAADDVDSMVKGIELGAEDYLPKPFNPMLLKARIQASLEKKQLYDKEQARLAELSIMQQIDAELNATLDVKRAMEITLDWALRRATGDAGFMGAIVDGQIQVLAQRGYTYELSVDQKLLPDELPAVQAACHSGELVYLPNTESVGLLMRTHSQIAIPVRREADVMAMLVLESTEPQKWDEELLHFLKRLCAHAAIAIANAQLYEAVQAANEAKTEFISFVSHELKAPMTSIKGYTDLLLSQNFGDLNEAQHRFLRTVGANVERMTRLVSDLQDVSRIEAGQLHLQSQPVSFENLIDEVLQSTQAQIAEKEQTLDLEISPDLPEVWGDPTRLAQILTNLVSNAYKYTPENGRITIRAEKTTEMNGHVEPKEMVHVSVADTGLGIREEDQQGIFTKFFRGNDEQALRAPGTGLGLNITKNLVEMHNGRIWFESKHRQGTTFHVVIPAAA